MDAIAALGQQHTLASNNNINNNPTVVLNANGTSSLTFFGQKTDNRFFHAPVKFTLTEIVQATQNTWQMQQQEVRDKVKRKREEDDDLRATIKRSRKEEHNALLNHLKSHENTLIDSILQEVNSSNSANQHKKAVNHLGNDVHLKTLVYLSKQKNGSIRKLPLSKSVTTNSITNANTNTNATNNAMILSPNNVGKKSDSDEDLMEA